MVLNVTQAALPAWQSSPLSGHCAASIGQGVTGVLRWLLEDGVSDAPATKPQNIHAGDEPRDCVLVIDASASMTADDWPPSRLAAAREASLAFCRRLAHEDSQARAAVVSYGTEAKAICSPTPATNIAALEAAIARIDVMGSTNIRRGLEQASSALKNSRGLREIVLLSDGHNTDRCPKSVARDLKQQGVTISCVGIGGTPDDVDEALMKFIASNDPNGSKRYRWIGDKERLVRHFEQLAGRITRG